MRYLSQIAHQTASRFVPARRAGWQPSVPPLVREQTIELPAIPDVEPEEGAGMSARDKPAPRAEAMEQGSGQASKQGSEDRPVDRRDAAPSSSEISLAAAARRRPTDEGPKIGQRLDTTLDGSPTEPIGMETAVPAQTEGTVAVARQAPPVLNESPLQVRPQAKATISSVLAEIERRRLELDLRYQQGRGPTVAQAEQSGPREPRMRESSASGSIGSEEAVHLNIGSIVVQVEPESAQNAAQPPRHALAPRETGRSWARSWLDR